MQTVPLLNPCSLMDLMRIDSMKINFLKIGQAVLMKDLMEIHASKEILPKRENLAIPLLILVGKLQVQVSLVYLHQMYRQGFLVPPVYNRQFRLHQVHLKTE